MTKQFEQMVSEVRHASRQLVRQFGLTNQTVAGTDLSISGVHAIIEIGLAGQISAKLLGEKLVLEKSTVSRLVHGLIKRDEIQVTPCQEDARVKLLQLTPKGTQTWKSIEEFAKSQVSNALLKVPAEAQKTILQGLTDYASVLGSSDESVRSLDVISDPEVKSGYTPSIIGNVVSTLHAHMNEHFGFGARFESRIAADLAEFVTRLDDQQNQIWWARHNNDFLGSISIDSHQLKNGYAHLRWFIVSEKARGQGVGYNLLRNALEFCDVNGFDETHLWTVKGLNAARKLYEKNGFVLADEYLGDQWGSEVVEQKFVRISQSARNPSVN